MNIQQISQTRNFNSTPAPSEVISLDQTMLGKAPAKLDSGPTAASNEPGVPEAEEDHRRAMELGKLVLDGTSRDHTEIIALCNELKSEDGTPYFSSIKFLKTQLALNEILKQIDAAPPDQYDPSLKEAVSAAITYLAGLQPVMDQIVEKATDSMSKDIFSDNNDWAD